MFSLGAHYTESATMSLSALADSHSPKRGSAAGSLTVVEKENPGANVHHGSAAGPGLIQAVCHHDPS